MRLILLFPLLVASCPQHAGSGAPSPLREFGVPDLDGDGVQELLVASEDSRSATGNYEWTLLIGPMDSRRAVSTMWARGVRLNGNELVLSVSGHHEDCEETMRWGGRELVPRRHRCRRYYRGGRLQLLPSFEDWSDGPLAE